ncbi:PTS mannnose transporter subunit IID [Latilactobacillus sakei]|uniref:PTS system mannose/fructose/sorbose family transporter subunit IID n=1 Tax=Latilactobacillus sakei TaxID=1599 RepID=UPI002072B99C|nr:PTS system mannose/fructose/sorbose family transporter subunit IID [Latilactobacillus sakei]USG07261.1 PTS mannnose transporter subunit IID [Latilactobacillus sakei]USG10937.1 PTS mannnose transporter subunit IID [Latilactobacillus sakei]
MKITKNVSPEDKKMLNGIFLRSFTVFASRAGATKTHAPGFMYSILPALDRYYKDDPEGHKEAMQRHTTWYNITQNVGTFVMGLVASMEKKNAEDPDFDSDSIVALKTSLMGPLSGIGDSIFWGVLRVIAAGIGISLASQGSVFGPLLFLIIYNVPAILTRYYLTYMGFTLGDTFIQDMYNSGSMKLLNKAASTLGLMMIGCMTATMVSFKSKLAIPIQGGKPIEIQTYLDQLWQGLVPLAVTLGCYWLLSKKVNVNWILLGVLVLAIVLGLLGVV